MTGRVTNYVGTNVWALWTGDTQLVNGQNYDAVNTAPAQDRLLFDVFTTALNDNATRGQLSVNVGASDHEQSPGRAGSVVGFVQWRPGPFQQCRQRAF